MPQTTIYAAPEASGTPETPPAVATVELARLFGRSAALADVSLRIEAGRLVSLTGPNGAGKTTLLRILATSLRPSFGTAAVDGIDVARDPQAVRARVAYLGHANGLYDDLTAVENLHFAAGMLGIPGPQAATTVQEALTRVGLAAFARDRVRGYSAGMRRRLALGRLLLARPSLVLLDEPHAALDADGMALVDRLIADWRTAGVSILIASHHADRVDDLADGWARLDNGLLTVVGGTGVMAGTHAVVDSVHAAPLGASR
jgi:heme exporter protein A